MPAPAIVVHGGAGAGPERLSNLQPAIEAARLVFESGGDAIEAAVEACVVLEDDPVFNAGTGSVMRNDGSVLTDASLQVSDGRMGFVAVMENTPNPIRICVDLLEEEINGLAGTGARIWADERHSMASRQQNRGRDGARRTGPGRARRARVEDASTESVGQERSASGDFRPRALLASGLHLAPRLRRTRVIQAASRESRAHTRHLRGTRARDAPR